MSRIISKRKYSYGMEKSRYLELRYFCLQYNQKKQELAEFSFLKAAGNSSGARGSFISDSTANTALRLGRLKQEVELIESAAKAMGESIAPYILKSVTEDIGYDFLGAVPCGQRQFYEFKRNFFKLLNQMK